MTRSDSHGTNAIRKTWFWGCLSQALSSSSNFLAGILVVRSCTLPETGAWSLAYVIYLFTLGLFRSLAAKTFTIRYVTVSVDQQRIQQRAVAGLAILVGLFIGSSCLLASLFLASPLRHTVAVLAFAMPALILFDGWRYMFVAAQRPSRAASIDAIWLLTSLVAFLFITLNQDKPSAAMMTIGWASGGVVGAISGLLISKVIPSISEGTRFATTHRDLNRNLISEHLVSQGANQLGILLLGLILPLQSLGVLRAGQLLYSPLNFTQQAASFIGLPRMRRAADSSHKAVMVIAIRTAISLMASVVILTIVLSIIPYDSGSKLLGDGWNAGKELLIPLCLRNLAGGVTVAFSTALLAFERADLSCRIGAARGMTSLITTVLAGSSLGLGGAVWGMVAADVFGAALCIRALYTEVHSQRASNPRTLRPEVTTQ